MQFNDLYRNYLKWQSANHPDLLHVDEQGKRVFDMIEVEQAFGDYIGEVYPKGYVMRGLNYTYQIRHREGEGQARKIIQGGFLVAKHFDKAREGEAGYYQAHLDTERVNDEIIEKMIADSQNGHPLFLYSLDKNQDFSVSPVPLAGDGSYTGWLTIFQFENFWRNCIDSPDAPTWLDGGVTPHTF